MSGAVACKATLRGDAVPHDSMGTSINLKEITKMKRRKIEILHMPMVYKVFLFIFYFAFKSLFFVLNFFGQNKTILSIRHEHKH